MKKISHLLIQVFTLCCLLHPLSAGAQEYPLAHSPELEQGINYFYQENYESALPLFKEALLDQPQNTLALSYMLHIYEVQKQLPIATRYIEEEAVARGEDSIALGQLGLAYFVEGRKKQGRYDDALAEFRSSIQFGAHNSIGYTGLGMVYFQKRKMPRAKGYFIRALKINSHDIMAMELLGNILLIDDKKPDEALPLFERIVAELPNYPDGHYYVGSALYDLGRYNEAIRYLYKASELDSKGLTHGYSSALLMGDAYRKTQQWEEAKNAYRLAQKMHPESKPSQDIAEQKIQDLETERLSKPETEATQN